MMIEICSGLNSICDGFAGTSLRSKELRSNREMQKTFRLIPIQKTVTFLLVALNIGLNLSVESVKRIEFFVLEG